MGTLACVERRLEGPIVGPHMDGRMGGNLCGPSLIRVPSWVRRPLGRYYLYFAHHMGRYIRMAYADEITGPWRMHEPGVLPVERSLFEATDPPEPDPADRPAWAGLQRAGYLYAHVASPDVHVDHESGRIVMYYHGLLANGDQRTRLALSSDGLAFMPRAPLLAPSYLRCVRFGGAVHGMSWAGALHRATSWEGPFETRASPLAELLAPGSGRTPRHVGLHVRGHELQVFFSCIGDRPERLYHSAICMRPDWHDWAATPPSEVLRPELAWEGAGRPPRTSEIGPSMGFGADLRDPFVFEDEGALHLLYAGGAEFGGIGLASLSFTDAPDDPIRAPARREPLKLEDSL